MMSSKTTDGLLDLLELLKARSRFLERILSHSQTFQQKPEDRTEINHLDQWLLKREKLFHTYELAEKRIEQISSLLLDNQKCIPLAIRTVIENEMQRAHTLIAKIKTSDEGVVVGIRETQERLLKQINDSRQLKDKLGRFRSDMHGHRGEELDAKG